jgi:hypothetical protein
MALGLSSTVTNSQFAPEFLRSGFTLVDPRRGSQTSEKFLSA